MLLSDEYIFLGARQYDFTDDANRRVQGVSVHLLPVRPSSAAGTYGAIPVKFSADISKFSTFAGLKPLSKATFDFDVEIGARSRTRLVGLSQKASV